MFGVTKQKFGGMSYNEAPIVDQQSQPVEHQFSPYSDNGG